MAAFVWNSSDVVWEVVGSDLGRPEVFDLGESE
jgi:hypothetical protein